MTRMRLVQLLLAVWGSWSLAEADWDCRTPCRCSWFHGKKYADCSKSNLTAVPDLGSDLQILVLTDNALEKIPARAFHQVGLINLHKLVLRSCGIRELDKDAFSLMALLIGIDLSSNYIHTLHPDTFRYNKALRYVFLSENPIQKLEDGLFRDLVKLQGVVLKGCQITHIARGTFVNVPKLTLLLLQDNKLTTVEEGFLDSIDGLATIGLHGNPWHCDCHLKQFWETRDTLYYSFIEPPVCAEPPRLKGKRWNEMHPQELSCKPQIVTPPKHTALVEAPGTNVTLACQALGNPTPEMHWTYNSEPLSLDSGRLFLETGVAHWLNLSLVNVRLDDAGIYTCVAKNAEGADGRVVMLNVNGSTTATEDEPVHLPPTVPTSPSTQTQLLFLQFLQHLNPSAVNSYCTTALEELKRKKEALVAERARSGLLRDQLKESQQQVNSLTSALIQVQLGSHQTITWRTPANFSATSCLHGETTLQICVQNLTITN